MRSRSLLLVTMLLAIAGNAAAQTDAGTIDLSWDDCAPIVTQKTAPPNGPVTFYASVLGAELPHKAHQVWWILCDMKGSVPDAWRFDDTGCNSGARTYAAQPPPALSKTCPGFVPAGTQQFLIEGFLNAYPTTVGVPGPYMGFAAVSYVDDVTQAEPGVRYHLARFEHDFTWAVDGDGTPGQTCGGFEAPVSIQLLWDKCTLLDVNVVEIPFARGNTVLLFRGATLGCLLVPAQPTTWGSLKNQYR